MHRVWIQAKFRKPLDHEGEEAEEKKEQRENKIEENEDDSA